ncbi:membrane-bound serine protease (ClpP class) [Pseudomonas sp. GM49]|uniref:NfeD family protein n=1 Tax=Pseudomonas sp. GM49 TaxID=1144331 RepID=UPI00027089A1|nr:nodulation protein NfeD [Pseudomonas sp. GM49]EJM73245.1 membrane-bound serine protease (ClpP class) [Pseudomonas sp. GM49]
MNSHWWCRLLLLVILIGLPTGSTTAAGSVVVLTVNDAIGPASADYVERGLARAVTEGAQLVVISLDTPGGLDTSMRLIIKAILASPLPVASFVAPSGARAASAGTYILYASHIAAMTPGTNLGAATPVQIGGLPGTAPEPPSPPTTDKSSARELQDTLTRKQINDAAAYIRGLAQLRGRNADWAEQAVRESLSLSAHEALKLNVVDYVANDVADLLKQLNGKSLNVSGQTLRLSTAGVALIDHAPDWRTQLLAVITNPSVALLLIMLGVYGLIFEFMNPGSSVGGVLGGICLLLGLYALQLLPVNYAGVGLILLGIAFMIAEAFLPSFGVIGFGGVVAFVVGAVILMDTDVPGFGIPLTLIIGMALVSALLLMTLVGMALKARRRALVSGDAGLVGSQVTVTGLLPGLPMSGWVQLQGEKWQVQSCSPLHLGQQVRVVRRTGVMLDVIALDETSPSGG